MNAITIAVPTSGWVTTSRQRRADHEEQWVCQLAQIVHALRTPCQERGGVQDERELQELGGLELERAGADPATGAVDAHPDVRNVRCEHEHERHDEQRRGEALHFRDPVTREHAHDDQTGRPVGDVLDQVSAAVAVSRSSVVAEEAL